MEKKMSSTDLQSAIFVTDTPAQIRTKIIRYAFSGGRATAAEHRELGADLSVDVCHQLLQAFLEDDEEFEQLSAAYASGVMLTGAFKQRTVDLLVALVERHQQYRREIVTDEFIDEVCSIRPIV
jgi:tryptophanyl-tRNA synthetase